MLSASNNFNKDRKSVVSDQPLIYEDETGPGAVMAYLNELRKQYQFADVHLSIENHIVPAHRAVLACSSPYLYDYYKALGESHSVPLKHLLENISPSAVELLVNFAYTGRLEVPYCQVATVYQAARQWQMVRVKNACARHLVQQLSTKNCLELRSFASEEEDVEFLSIVDDFLKKNIDSVALTNEFQELPRLQIEVVATKFVSKMSDRQLFETALDWIRRTIKCGKQLEDLQQEPQTLLLSENNTLKDVEEFGEIEPDLIKNYKLDAKRCPLISPAKVTNGVSNGDGPNSSNNRNGGNNNNNPNGPARRLVLSPEDLTKARSRIEKWKIVASTEMGANRYIAITILGGSLFVIMLYEKPSSPKVSSPTPKRSFSIESEGIHPSLATLEQPRCAVGVAKLDGKLVAAGGFNRDECHQSVEMYDPHTNTMDKIAPMQTQRARFEFGVIGRKLYAAGGSDGHMDLRTCEVYDPETDEWSWVADMPQERPNSGAAVLDGRLYVVGGSSGNVGLRSCDVYHPDTNVWISISKMNQRRAQVGVCSLNGKIFAVGGSSNWNCHNSVEVYDPKSNTWGLTTPLSTSRRGAAVCTYNGKIFALGGSDGQSVLNTVECFDPDTAEWTNVASMSEARVNAGATVIDGLLYAVGGFNGKHFLGTLECYNPAGNQWHTVAMHMMRERNQDSPTFTPRSLTLSIEEEEAEESKEGAVMSEGATSQ
ncbi:influenza virus NS1A-binding protein homolog isoform X2 [Acanthaster planci]|uniref:Influenza virus NS1A-binding protein homolog isoform X2 n=1 Tax=Acanthaster planci TaxID=133434 RepID=A0A8B7ZMK9_ACAPL|nr:influenza virus NS1A-binding protein homolog isoform X2 [Acanthaster planci]